MPESILPQVKTIVFLMLENRSLDNVLGWLYEHDNPGHVFPSTSSKTYDGLQTGAFSNPAEDWLGVVKSYPVAKRPDNLGQYSDQLPYYDPYEPLAELTSWNGVMNQLFGNEGRITQLPLKPTVAAMQGFLQDYYTSYMLAYKGLDILWTYTPEDLPVINGLARCYAVSDRWFCSVPSNTNPNRAYSICGTSLGEESYHIGNFFQKFDAPTVFNSLADAGKSLGLYYTDSWIDAGKSYTEYTFPQIANVPRFTGGASNPVTGKQIDIGDIATFRQRANDGTLPNFTYLEPQWGYGHDGGSCVQGTDYHPPTHLLPGESFLEQVYNAVRNGKNWQETLLIVTFDEHGGSYDHVAPPWTTINPDGKNGPSGFAFDLFGVRVPTILISPFVYPKTVFRAPEGSSNPMNLPFDHTSFIKTLLLWAGVDPEKAGLGKRMPQAPPFDYVFASEPVNPGDCLLKRPKPLVESSPTALAGSEQGPLAGSGQPLNSLFEGVPFGVIKAILGSSQSPAQIRAEIERYRKDPERFEALLKKPLTS